MVVEGQSTSTRSTAPFGQHDGGDAIEHIALAGAGGQVKRRRQLVGKLQAALEVRPGTVARRQQRVLLKVLAGQVTQAAILAAKQETQCRADGLFLVLAVAAKFVDELLVAAFIPACAIHCRADAQHQVFVAKAL